MSTAFPTGSSGAAWRARRKRICCAVSANSATWPACRSAGRGHHRYAASRARRHRLPLAQRQCGGTGVDPIWPYHRRASRRVLAASPFYHLLQNGGEELRWRIAFGDPIDFPHRPGHEGPGSHRLRRLRPSNCPGSHDRRDGLRLLRLVDAPLLWASAMPTWRPCAGWCRRSRSPSKSAALARIAGTLVEVYLAAMPAGACSKAASSAVWPIASMQLCGSPTCAATRRSPTRRRPARSFPCSTTTPKL